MTSTSLKVTYSKQEDDNVLACPVCGFEYNHVGSVEKKFGNDNYESGYSNIRGDVLVISMSCENGHEYDICLGGHKGWVYFFAVNKTKRGRK